MADFIASDRILCHGDVAAALHRIFYLWNTMTTVPDGIGCWRSVDGQYRIHRLDGVNISPVFRLAGAVGVLVGVCHGSAAVVRAEILCATRKRGGQRIATPISNTGHYTGIQQVRRQGVGHAGDSGFTVSGHSPPFHNNADGGGCIDLAPVHGIIIEDLHVEVALTEIGGYGQSGVIRGRVGRQVPTGGVSIDHPVQCVVVTVNVFVRRGGHHNVIATAKVIRRPTERKFVMG